MHGNQNYHDESPKTGQDEQHQKDLPGISPTEGTGKTELPFILYWDVNWYRNYGKQHRGSLKKSKCSETARSGSPTPGLSSRRNQNWKRHMCCCSQGSMIYNTQDTGINQIQSTNQPNLKLSSKQFTDLNVKSDTINLSSPLTKTWTLSDTPLHWNPTKL